MIKEQKVDSVDCTTPTEVIDRTAMEEVPVFTKPDDDNYDLDESNPSVLNWSTTSGDDDDADVAVPSVRGSQIESVASSEAHEEDLLRLSQDKWAELPSNQFHKVFLCNFYHPDRIYIRNSFYSTRCVPVHFIVMIHWEN